ncbi:uncharacterized protein E0L32_010323 [Thyridium curvatum]|uniref:Uncharacterized protein n=1 Tax=Thyridium curvatum TaxID=1093900 RepID=A0A507AGM3_9PEZI|nr:uncharacterized protein E0L32_010323 [Thyridium curvatum]TPX07992.1 hypothetical protein E0L32_010323 [Thyridium curvatum]
MWTQTRSLEHLWVPINGINFDAVYMAEHIGSYKPDLHSFEYMIEYAGADLLVARNQILHTAQALWQDHVPARKVGLDSCWIMRGGKNSAMGGDLDEPAYSVSLAYRFNTLCEMAGAVENAFQMLSK